MMWTWSLQLAAIFVLLQMPGCFPSCITRGSVAYCSFRNLRSVPSLPPNTTHLFLDQNHISEINASSLSGLEELQELDLGGQRGTLVIRDNAFIGLSRLRTLKLDSNRGLQLEPDAFAGLSGLRRLHLGYCSLNDSILSDNFLLPLSSLETLDLFGNHLRRLQPSMFLHGLKELNLKLNRMERICEPDLVGLRGNHFDVLNLDSVHLHAMSRADFDWPGCGNPFRGLSFNTLDLSHIGFSLGTWGQFFRAIAGTRISRLKMSGHLGKGRSFNNLPDPDSNTFEGLRDSSLLTLDLSRNRIFALQPGVFSPLTHLVNIDLSRNRLNQIHGQAFEGLRDRLESLNLSHNLLGELYSGTFASLTNLRVLDLSHNHIGALGYNAFRGLPNLEVLNLTRNSLRELGFPAALPRLRHLQLNENQLTSSSVGLVLWFASSLSHLDVSDNRLTDLADVHIVLTQLKRLRQLSFSGNPIKGCTASAPVASNHLWDLDLHSSSLQSVWSQGKCLDLFDNLGQVIALVLSANSLRTIPLGVFKGLTSVIFMDLSSNALTSLRPDVLPQSLRVLDLSDNFLAYPDPAAFSSLSFLNLEMNRFHCDLNLGGFLTWLTQTNVTFLSPVEDLRCEFPRRLHKVPLLTYQAQVTARYPFGLP